MQSTKVDPGTGQDLDKIMESVRRELTDHQSTVNDLRREIAGHRGWADGESEIRDRQKAQLLEVELRLQQARTLLGGVQLTEVQQAKRGRKSRR